MASAAASDVGRSALRKASLRLLPLIALGYGVSYIDRSNISFAALQMNQELKFSAAVYGLGAGLFFLSYALFEVPSNLLLVRFGARRWIARIMLTWGLLAAGMMFVRTPWQFYSMRFLLGLAEAGFFPGVVFYLAQWFPPPERGRAISRFYVAVPLSSAVMGSIAGGLLSLHGAMGLSGWQWLFLVEGVPAVLLSVAFLVMLPDKPADARWLTGDEKAWMAANSAAEAKAHGGAHWGLARSLLDPTVLKFAAVNFLFLGGYYAFNLSGPVMIREATGWSAGQVGLLTTAAGLVGAASMLLCGWSSDRKGERYFHLIVPLMGVMAGYALFALTKSPWVMAGAFILAMAGSMAVAPVFWLPVGERIPPAAAAAAIAAINCVGQTGSFLSTTAWGWAHDRTGSYAAGLVSLPLVYGLAAAILVVLWLEQRARLRAPALAAVPSA